MSTSVAAQLPPLQCPDRSCGRAESRSDCTNDPRACDVTRARPAPQPPASANGAPAATGLRVGLASVLHWSDRLIRRAVAAYDGLFALDQEDTASIYLNLAGEMVRDNRLEDALAAARHALQIAPGNPHTWRLLADIHLRRESYAEAVDAISAAKKLGADDVELDIELADALVELDRLDDAVVCYFRVLEQRPQDAHVYFRLGLALDRLEHYEDAVTALRKAVEFDPRRVAYYQSLGFALESLGNREEAISCFKRAVALEQRSPK